MIYLLFVSLCMLTVVAYLASKRSIISPWVVACGIFAISTFFAMINEEKWGYTLHARTVLVILSALMVFGIAACLSTCAVERLTSPPASRSENPDFIPLKKVTVCLICAACLAAAAYCFYMYYQFSVANGNKGGLGDMVKYIREASLKFKSPGRLVGHLSLMIECASYILAFIAIRNTVFYGAAKRYILFFVPTACHMVVVTIAGGRTEFIYIAVFFLMSSFICFMQKHHWQSKYTGRLILIGLGAFLAFLLVFRLTGFLKDSGVGVSVFSSVSKYTGFGIPALDEYLTNLRPETGLIGDHTLSSLYSALRTLGFNLPQLYMPYDFIKFPGIDSNIYTALRRYIEDFTFLGMYILVFIIGALYTFFFEYIKKKKIFGFALVCFCAFCYPLFEFSIEERFLMRIFSTTTAYQLIYLGAFYYFFIYRSVKKGRAVKKPAVQVF